MAAHSNRDLGFVPNVYFSISEEFIQSHTGASRNKSISKGLKYVHDLKIKKIIITSLFEVDNIFDKISFSIWSTYIKQG